MRRFTLPAIGVLLLLVGVLIAAVALPGRATAPVSAPAAAVEEEEEGLGPAEPDDYFLAQRTSGTGKLDTAALRRATRQAVAVRAQGAAAQAPRQMRGAWELTGPTNVGGRIVDLAITPADPNVAYVAAATGGVWKATRSTNAAGQNAIAIEKAWPDHLSQSMGAIDIGSDGRIWAGTGEHNPGGGSITFGGTGVYVSSDGGATWKKSGLENSGTTGRIEVDPANPNRIFVAASGDLFNPGGDRGVYRSDDGGATWQLVLAPETPFTGGIDLAIDPSNPQRIFAAMWDHRREPDLRTYGGLGSGLFRSDDGGNTWKRLENVLTFSPGDASGLSQSTTLGRIGVALAPSNPNRVYVITTATFGQDKGFYVSDDGGESFNAQTRPGSQGGFGWWFGRLWVDPANQNHLFAAGVNLRRSTNGGATWGNSGSVHADQHAMEFSTAQPGLVWLGNDGGTYVSTSNGANGTWRQAEYEPYSQHYTLNVAHDNVLRRTAGLQDNGGVRSWTPASQTPGDPGTWSSYSGGDGESTPIDWETSDIYYGCSQYGSCTRFNDNVAAHPEYPRRSLRTGTGATSARWNWLSPLEIAPHDAKTIYFAGNVLNKSTNRGTTFTPISPSGADDLTGTFESPDRVDPLYPNWGTITAVGLSKTAPDTIYVGTDTGRLWRTTTGGGTTREAWTELTGRGLPNRWVTRVAIDPRNENVVYATFSGFRSGEDAAHVYRSTDGGETWENISGNLPNAPVNDVVVDTARETVYVGTDVGVFYNKNGKKNWHAVGSGLPLVPVLDLALHEPTATLFAGTFGRSAWQLPVGG